MTRCVRVEVQGRDGVRAGDVTLLRVYLARPRRIRSAKRCSAHSSRLRRRLGTVLLRADLRRAVAIVQPGGGVVLAQFGCGLLEAAPLPF